MNNIGNYVSSFVGITNIMRFGTTHGHSMMFFTMSDVLGSIGLAGGAIKEK